jgi:hypothetical protein
MEGDRRTGMRRKGMGRKVVEWDDMKKNSTQEEQKR